jgi:hypothetical protein
LARVPAGVDAATLNGATGRSVGEILAVSKTADVVDGHLGLVVQSGDTVLTSDAKDIRKVLAARGVGATVRRV